MLATWIRDVYGYDDRTEMRAAIDDIASPLDSYGLASAGVYVFFDPKEFEILYIGLARDLAERLRSITVSQACLSPAASEHSWKNGLDDISHWDMRFSFNRVLTRSRSLVKSAL